MREDEDYQSLNYKFFNTKYDHFLYVDRIAVHSKYRRSGIGTLIYKYIYCLAQKQNLPIFCEVNSRPANKISLNFHNKQGFKEVGHIDHGSYEVVCLKKTF